MKDKKNNFAMWLFSEKVSNGLNKIAGILAFAFITFHTVRFIIRLF